MNSLTSSLPRVDAPRLLRLLELGRTLNSASDTTQLLPQIVEEAVNLTQAEVAALVLVDPQTQELYCAACSLPNYTPHLQTEIPRMNTVAGYVLQTGEPQLLYNVHLNLHWSSAFKFVSSIETRSILSVPMYDGEQIIGTLEIANKRMGEFTEEDVEILSALASWAGVAIGKQRLEDELKQVTAELDELDRIKNEFIAIASHELQTPLAVILGYASFLRDDADSDTSHQLDRVLKAGMRLRSLMQDMLSLRYVDAGETELDLSHFDLAAFVRRTAQSRSDLFDAKLQNMTLSVTNERLPVIGDQDMLEVVIDTLLNNAVKFTPEGGQIGITVEERNGLAVVCVADTGVGIDEGHLRRIFGRFYQIEPNICRLKEGLGLGLAIAKDLVALHEGRIWAESVPGYGSQFYFTLPLARLNF